MSERSVNITVINVSSSELVLESKTHLNSGKWVVAPTNVPSDGQKYNFSAGDVEMLPDVDGTIYYSVPGGEISLSFEDPFMGGNKFHAYSTSAQYDVQTDGGQGEDCNVTYTVSNK